MLHFKLILAACLIAVLSAQPLYAGNDDDHKQLRRNLETYQEIKHSTFGMCGFGMPWNFHISVYASELSEHDICVREFARGLLDNREFYEHWGDAWYLLAYETYMDDESMADLAQELIDYAESQTTLRDENDFLTFLHVMTIISGMIGPTYMHDENLMRVITEGVTPWFEEGNPVETNYWLRRFGASELIGLDADAASANRGIVYWANQISWMISQLAWHLSQVSDNPVYENSLNSIRKAQYSSMLKEWQTGQFDLFGG